MSRTLFCLRDEPGIADPAYTWAFAVAVVIIVVGAKIVERLAVQLFPGWSPQVVLAFSVVMSLGGLVIIVGLIAGGLWWVSKHAS